MKRIVFILALACATLAQAQTIGRLFTTPQERYQLDVARGLIVVPAAPAPVRVAPAPAPPPPEPVTVNGFVRRSSGGSTVWLNQDAQDARLNNFSGPRQAPRVTVTLPSGRKVLIKPGQTVDMNAGTVTDAVIDADTP